MRTLDRSLSSPAGVTSSFVGGTEAARVHLRAILERLDVGHDGFMDREEFADVCRAIGMQDLPQEVVHHFVRVPVEESN